MAPINPIQNLDPAITLSQDIARFVVDWAHISGIHKVDKILIHIGGVEVKSSDLKQLLKALLIQTPGEGSEIEVNETHGRYKCRHYHISSEKKCAVCGSEHNIQVLPNIKMVIEAGKKKAELHI